MKSTLIILLQLISLISFAQLPETRIYTLDISRERGNKMKFSKPKLISNNVGYNNQPYFTDDDKYILYTSNNGKGNTDIFRYDIKKKKSKRLTKTKESEYSPQYSLNEDEISCVRVEKDTVTQHFYAYTKNGKPAHLMLPDVKELGYYTWLNGVEIIGLTLPEPFTLTKYNVVTLKADTLCTSPGRTFHAFHGKVYYVDKSDSNHYYIRMIAKENLRPKKGKAPVENPIIVETLSGQEDFTITYDGTFLMGSEGKLFSFTPKKAKQKTEAAWIEIADFKAMGIDQFYRLALNNSSDQLAVVMYVGKKP